MSTPFEAVDSPVASRIFGVGIHNLIESICRGPCRVPCRKRVSREDRFKQQIWIPVERRPSGGRIEKSGRAVSRQVEPIRPQPVFAVSHHAIGKQGR